ncbi:MAG: hypothetical protein GY867_09760 [bacterium]|nr:hypothetical protein [bacterium]
MTPEGTRSRLGSALPAIVLALGISLGICTVGATPALEDWCCEGGTGDVNMDGQRDITDIAVLIDNQFLTLTPLPCWGEADLDLSYSIDITDIMWLIDAHFIHCTMYFPDCPPPPQGGVFVGRTGCKSMMAPAATADFYPSDQSCIAWDYHGDSILNLTHANAGFNCCPTLDISVDVEGGTIALREVETLGECNCLCLYDLDFEIHGLPPGIYRVVAEEPYLSHSEEPLDFYINLDETPVGDQCVLRTEYPWGAY